MLQKDNHIRSLDVLMLILSISFKSIHKLMRYNKAVTPFYYSMGLLECVSVRHMLDDNSLHQIFIDAWKSRYGTTDQLRS